MIKENNIHENRLHWNNFLLILFSILGIGLMVSLALQSDGMPVQDEIAHYNISRQAWHDPKLILDTWGRPINTLFFMLPALHSWFAARVFAIVYSTFSLILTILTAQKMQIKTSLFMIPVLLLFQPWFHQLGFTAITEVPFCLVMIAGVYFCVSEHYSLASLCFGSLVLIRHEGIALLGAWCLWMIVKRRWKSLAVAILPYILYSVLYWIVFRKTSLDIFLSIKPTNLYGSGSWFHFVKPTLNETGILPVVLSLLAIPAAIRLREKGMVFLLYGIYFFTHTIIFRFGLFASGGYYLFLMPLATGFALAAALALESIYKWIKKLGEKFQRKSIATMAFVTITSIVAITMLASSRNSKPYQLNVEEIALQKASDYLHKIDIPAEQVYSTHAFFEYLYDLPRNNWIYKTDWNIFKQGSILVWDSHYSDRWGMNYDWLMDPASSFKIRKIISDGQVVIFEKR